MVEFWSKETIDKIYSGNLYNYYSKDVEKIVSTRFVLMLLQMMESFLLLYENWIIGILI